MKKILFFIVFLLLSTPSYASFGACAFGDCDSGGVGEFTTLTSGELSVTEDSVVGIGTLTPDPRNILTLNGDLFLMSPDGLTSYPWNDSLDFFNCGDNNLCWKPNATTGVFGIQYSGGVQISIEHDGTNMVLDSTSGGVSTSDFFRAAMQTVTVASDGAGTSPSGTVTPTSNNIRLQCNDTDGCTMSMSETGAQTGVLVIMVNNTSNAITFADSSGVLELPGGTSIVLGINDVLAVFYQNSTWVHAFSSNN